MEGLTINEERKVGHPYASRNRHDELLHIPNSDAGRNHELNFASGRRWYNRNVEDDVHAEYYQEGSGNNG
jgi:hypothetical protein